MVWRPPGRPRTEARGRRRDGHSRDLTPDGPLRKHYPATFIAGGGARSAAGNVGQQRSTRVSAAAIRRRTAGRLGLGGGPGSGGLPALFPPEPQVLQEGEGQQAQQRVVVQPAPGAALEVVEPQLVLELLVQLLADPARLDQGGQGLERGVGRQVREVVLALAVGAVL